MVDKKSDQICVKIEPEIYKKLKEYAQLEERSVGFLIRRMIDDWLGKKVAGMPQKKKVNEK